MGQLDGKVAIVTGTSRGVGVGIARRLLQEGASVAGCSRRPGVSPTALRRRSSNGAAHLWLDGGDLERDRR
jgi:NAD(P)-dependent dehydrogenase (short-subunit alcohol dehydrogenase family)